MSTEPITEPTPEPKATRRKMPSAVPPEEETLRPFEITLDDVEASVGSLRLSNASKRADDNEDLFVVRIKLSFDVREEIDAIPYGSHFGAIRVDQADVGPKAIVDAKIRRAFAPGRLRLLDRILDLDVTLDASVRGDVRLRIVGEKKVRFEVEFDADVVGSTAYVALSRMMKRSVRATLLPSQMDLFEG